LLGVIVVFVTIPFMDTLHAYTDVDIHTFPWRETCRKDTNSPWAIANKMFLVQMIEQI
jgi:hypothetical protein